MRIIYIYVLLLSFFITSCGKKEAVTEQKPKTDTVSKKTDIPNDGIKSAGNEEKQDGITDLKFDAKEYEKDISIKGSIVASAQWKDKAGLNVFVITETKPVTTKTNDYDESISKRLYAYVFVKNEDNKFKQVWVIEDFIDKCQVDLTLSYILKSLSITDLNKNGIAETTFLYKMSCKGDVSPNDLKLMMHEGKEKYAIRGETTIKFPNGETYGGSMKVDKSFDAAPKEFLDYASKEFRKHQEEKLNVD